MVVPNGSVNMNNQGCLKDVQAALIGVFCIG